VTAVVIGRFQVAQLHEGHIALLSAVSTKSTRMVVLIGCSPAVFNAHDPLPFFCRQDAVRMVFPQATVLPLYDMASDKDWSNQVDHVLKDFGPCTIYGGRESSLAHYSGQHPVEELDLNLAISGSQMRAAETFGYSFEFRQGMVYAATKRFPVAFPTVDIAVIRDTSVLLGRKRDETYWRFPGGFSDPADASFEHTAARELQEETGLSPGVDQFRYVGSRRLDDWRYRGSVDKIKTLLYAVPYGFGIPKASDDLVATAWAPIYSLKEEIHPTHKPLAELLIPYVEKGLLHV
jgi:bifunctional NMN adenylyltransferase/nudix hydrolase